MEKTRNQKKKEKIRNKSEKNRKKTRKKSEKNPRISKEKKSHGGFNARNSTERTTPREKLGIFQVFLTRVGRGRGISQGALGGGRGVGGAFGGVNVRLLLELAHVLLVADPFVPKPVGNLGKTPKSG